MPQTTVNPHLTATAGVAENGYLTVNDNQYIDHDENGVAKTKEIPGGTIPLAYNNSTNWSAGWYVAAGNIEISSRVTIPAGSDENNKTVVNLLLKNRATLHIKDGIELNDNTELNIYAQSDDPDTAGKLLIDSVGWNKAGIGTGANSRASFTVNIHGGTINTQSGNMGAGIGTGFSMQSGQVTITINGGTINTQGRYGSAGIGTGFSMQNGTVTVTINGGTINTQGRDSGAGIGSGIQMKNGQVNITINGGTINGGAINTQGGTNGAGIGSGYGSIGGTRRITLKNGPIIINNDALGVTPGENNTYSNDYGDTFIYEPNTVIFTGTYSTEASGEQTFTLKDSGTITGNKTLPASVKFLTGINNVIPQYGAETTFNYAIPADKILTIGENSSLTNQGKISVDQGGALTIAKNGTLENNGPLTNAGTITNNWKVTGTGTFTDNNGTVNPFQPTVSTRIEPNRKATATAQPVPFTPVEFNFDGDGWGTTSSRTYDAGNTAQHTVSARIADNAIPNDPTWLKQFYTGISETFYVSQQPPSNSVGTNFDASYTNGTITAHQGYEIKESTQPDSEAKEQAAVPVVPDKTYQIRTKAAEGGLSASAWVIIPAFTFQNTPSIGRNGLSVTNPTTNGGSDGVITGQADTQYEYRTAASAPNGQWTPFNGNNSSEQTSLGKGDYQVRVKGNATGTPTMPSAPVTVSPRYISLSVAGTISVAYGNTEAKPITVTNNGEDTITISNVALATGGSNENSKFDLTDTPRASVLLAPGTSAKIGSIKPIQNYVTNLEQGQHPIALQLSISGSGVYGEAANLIKQITYAVATAGQYAPVFGNDNVSVSADSKLAITPPNGSEGKNVQYCVKPVVNNIFTTTPSYNGGCTWQNKSDVEEVVRDAATSYAVWARYAAVDTNYAASPASNQAVVTTPPADATVAGSNIDYVKETIDGKGKLEFSKAQDFTSDNVLADGAKISELIKDANSNPTGKLYVRVKKNDATGTPASNAVEITLHNRPATPVPGETTAPTYSGMSDGTIKGLYGNTTYEISDTAVTPEKWTPATNNAGTLTGLTAGTYKVRIAASQGDQKFASLPSSDIEISVGAAQSNELEAEFSATGIVFDSVSYNTSVAAMEVKVKPKAGFNAPVKINNVVLEGADKDSFTLTSVASQTAIAVPSTGEAPATKIADIAPKADLTEKTYTALIKVTYQATAGDNRDEQTLSIPVKLTVNQADQTAPDLTGKVTATETSINISGVAAQFCVLPATDSTDIATACQDKWTANTSIPAASATSFKVVGFYPAVPGRYAASEVSAPVFVTTKVPADAVKAANINYPSEALIVAADSNLQFATDPNFAAVLGNGAKLSQLIDATGDNNLLYARVKGTGGAPASAATLVRLPARPVLKLAPAAASSSNKADGKLTGLAAGLGYVYQKQGDPNWISVPAGATEITGLTPAAYLVTIPATATSFAAKQPASVTVTALTTAIGELSAADVSENSITVNALAADPITGAAAEYSINGANWQPSPIFTGLQAATSYVVSAQYVGQPASGITTVNAATKAAAPSTEVINGDNPNPGENVPAGIIDYHNGNLNNTAAGQLEYSTSKDFTPGTILPAGTDITSQAGETIYVRTKGDAAAGIAPSAPVEVHVPKQAATPNVGLADAGTITGLEPGHNYQIDNGDSTWQPVAADAPLAPGTYQLRETGSKENNLLPSAPVKIVVTSPITDFGVAEADETTVKVTPITPDPATGATAEYSIDGGKTWQAEPEFTGLQPGSAYQVAARYQAPSADAVIATPVTVKAATAAAAPNTTSIVDYKAEAVKANDQLEYSTSPDFVEGSVLTAEADLSALSGQTIYVRYKANPITGAAASKAVEVKVPVAAKTPAAVVSTDGVVSGLDPNLAYEYQKDGDTTWIAIPAGTTALQLNAGRYLLRVQSDPNSGQFASEPQELVIPKTTGKDAPDTGTDTHADSSADRSWLLIWITGFLPLLALLFSVPLLAIGTNNLVIPGINNR